VLPDAHPDALVPEEPYPLPDQHPMDAIPQERPALDAWDAVRPAAKADATVPAQADARCAGRLADPGRVVPAQDAMRPARLEVESAPYKPGAVPSAA